MRVRLDVIACLALLMVWTLLPTVSGVAAAQAQTTLQIVPQTVKVRTGQQVTVDLRIAQVSDLYGAELHLTFDPQVLEVVDADPEQDGVQIEPGFVPAPDYVALNAADNISGTIHYALTQLPPRDPVSGDGVMARVTFRGKMVAVSEIGFSEYLLANNRGELVEAIAQNGQVRVMSGLTWLYIAAAGVAVLLIVGGGVGFVIRRGK